MDKKAIISKYLIDLAISILIGVAASMILKQQAITLKEQITVFYVFMSAFWGWKYLNVIQPKMFVAMSIFGWAIYFMLKLVISMFAGIFVLPYQTIKTIISIIN